MRKRAPSPARVVEVGTRLEPLQQQKPTAPEAAAPAPQAATRRPTAFDDWTRTDTVFVAVLTLLALALRLFRLDHRGMWTDEFHTLDAISRPWGEMLLERLKNGHLPAYFVLVKSWTHFFGTTDWSLRFPSAVAGCLLVPAVAVFARRFVSRRFLWLLLGIACLNGLLIWASQEARMYGMLAVTATLCHAAWLRVVERPAFSSWLLYFAALLGSVLLQPVSVFLFFGHLAFSWIWRTEHPAHWRVVRWIAAGVAVLIVAGATAYARIQVKRAGVDPDWPSVDVMAKRLSIVAFGGRATESWFKRIAELLAFLCLVGVWRRCRVPPGPRRFPHALASPRRVFLRFCAAAVGAPCAAMLVLDTLVPHVVGPERYLIPLCAPLWVLVIYGAGAAPLLGARGAALAAAVLIASGAVVHYRDEGLGAREMVRLIAHEAAPGDVVILRSAGSQSKMLRHYGARQVAKCVIPDTMSDAEAMRKLQDNLRGRRTAWLFLYRDENPRLPVLLSQQPAWFRNLKEWRKASAQVVKLGVSVP